MSEAGSAALSLSERASYGFGDFGYSLPYTLGGWRSIGTSVSVIVGTGATMLFVALLGGGDEQRGFLATVLLGGLSLVALAMLFRNCRERFEDRASPSFKVSAAIGKALRIKPDALPDHGL